MTAVDAPNGSFAEQGENDVQVEGDVSPPAAVGKGSEVRQKRPPRLQTLDEELFEEDTKRYSPTSRGIIRDMGVEFARRFTSGEQSEEYQFPTDVNNDWAFDRETLEKLSAGKALFGFSCKVATALTDEERGLAKLVINRTAFADETAENNVQKIDLDNLVWLFFFFLNFTSDVNLEMDVGLHGWIHPTVHHITLSQDLHFKPISSPPFSKLSTPLHRPLRTK